MTNYEQYIIDFGELSEMKGKCDINEESEKGFEENEEKARQQVDVFGVEKVATTL